MKGAGLVYVICGLLVVGAGLLGILFGSGFVPAAVLLAIWGVSFLLLGRGLVQGKSSVRGYAIACSSLIVLGFGGEAIWFVAQDLPALQKFGISPLFWWMIGPFAAMALIHALALVLLLRSGRASSA